MMAISIDDPRGYDEGEEKKKREGWRRGEVPFMFAAHKKLIAVGTTGAFATAAFEVTRQC
jgi:hypothetical protein